MMNSQEILRALQAGEFTLEEAKARLTNIREKNNRSPQRDEREAIAVIGMSGRYPGADNLETYWANLAQGRNSIREIPKSRWDVHSYFEPYPPKDGKIYCKWLGLLDDVDCFDPLFFHISPSEAEMMDPQQRIFLQEAYRAFEDAGYTPAELNGKQCGVYLGIMGNEYYRMLCDRKVGLTDLTGNNASIAAARIAYFLNLKGPAISVDTACSSSLVAITLACQALLHREIDMALAGGVSLYLTPEPYIGMCSAGMLSPDGQCKAFDQSGNGMVPGEGAGALVLKRLKDAEADRDHIYGLIIGFGMNQDGKTNGITAPSIKSQFELERSVYQKFNIDPAGISYAEMHGTGTKLGDPIELKALSAAFRERTEKKNYCAIGSVKSNIGHTSAAAGVAGVHKVLLCMRHKLLVPTLNFTEPNEHFDFADSPFYINTETIPWEAPAPRRACVSSFGFSGTNAHLVIEEYLPRQQRAGAPVVNADHPVLVVLSAKTEERLKVYAGIMKEWVQAQERLNLGDLAYTLQTGREAMECRLAFWAGSKDEVIGTLDAFVNGNHPEGLLTNQVKKGAGASPASPGHPPGKARRDQIAAWWIVGGAIDWNGLYEGSLPQRIPLPGYPFAKERYWLPGRNPVPVNGNRLHPLLHRNTSDLSVQRFSSTLTGKEPFLTDHVIHGRRILPGSACLEMARAALELALHPKAAKALRDGRTRIRLVNHVWAAPLAVGEDPVEVHICLTPEEDGAIDYEIYSGSLDPEDETNEVHSQGSLVLTDPVTVSPLDVAALQAQSPRKILTPEQIYPAFRAAGIAYGPSHRLIERLYLYEDQILAKLSLPSGVNGAQGSFFLHPGLIDSALQAAAGFAIAANAPLTSLPYSLETLDILATCSAGMWAYIRRRDGNGAASPGAGLLDLDLCNEDGGICVQIRGFSTRPVNSLQREGAEDAFYLDLSERIWKGELSEEEVERILTASR
ncbi:type I polyketide synthase [Thermoactinomyces sp. CICC 10523]|nr:type I polyketide synthase [Thermoactinomyces sp. CICC 10523]